MTDREEVGVDALATAAGFAHTENAAIAHEAELAVSDAAERIALRHYTAAVVDERLWPGSASTRVTAAAGLRATRRLELAAHNQTRTCIKAARRDGMGWAEIGALLGLGPDAAEDGLTMSEAAFGFAVGLRDANPWNEVVFYWTCRTRGQAISDRGPNGNHEANEGGHAEGYARVAATVAAWDAEWTHEGCGR